MKVCKCDRCGEPVEHENRAILTMGIANEKGFYEHFTSMLCEQCYQTIKEVLEDGEIK